MTDTWIPSLMVKLNPLSVRVKPLSTVEREKRRPPPPAERVGALQDNVHRDVGKHRVARTTRVRSR